MGTIYRSLCGCLRSGEEPSIGDRKYDIADDAAAFAQFARDHAEFHGSWARECDEHELVCTRVSSPAVQP